MRILAVYIFGIAFALLVATTASQGIADAMARATEALFQQR